MDTQTQRKEGGLVKTDTETGVMGPQAKGDQEPPEAGGGRKGFSLEHLEHGPVGTLISGFWPEL